VTGGIRAVWAAPGTTRIEFFHDGGCDENGSGEGETLVGAIDVERDASGFAAFTISLPVSLGPGEPITATATSADGTTSPFSHCSPASSGCILPLLTNVPPFYVSLRSGESTTLTAAASGSVPFSFQWSQVAIGGSSPIPGATSSSFTTPALTSSATYSVVVTNPCGTAAAPNTTVAVCSSAPSVRVSPASQTVPAGGIVRISAVTPDGPAATYQWYVGTSGDTAHPAELGNGQSYITPPLTESVDFWARVTDACGTTDGPTAHVTVLPGPTIRKVTVKTVRGRTSIVAKGDGFTTSVYVAVDGVGFAAPAVVRRKKVTQSGVLFDGRSIDEAIPRGATVTLAFGNDTGASTSVGFTRP
jgi:hypothetical protein